MTFDAFITLIEAKIQPHSLNDIGTTKIANLYRKYPSDFLIQCVDIGAEYNGPHVKTSNEDLMVNVWS